LAGAADKAWCKLDDEYLKYEFIRLTALDKVLKIPHSMTKPKAIDLFAGCGGLTEGLKQAGFRVIGAIESNELAVKTYKANHKNVRVWSEDIRKVSVADVKRKLKLKKGKLDLLAGCPPCQGFSTITTLNGNQKRSTDERNELIFEFMRFVRTLRPKAIMLENVPRLATNWRMRLMLAELRRLGYGSSTATEPFKAFKT
jgi:DNA (cytosine-5)-methyltransferase 1